MNPLQQVASHKSFLAGIRGLSSGVHGGDRVIRSRRELLEAEG